MKLNYADVNQGLIIWGIHFGTGIRTCLLLPRSSWLCERKVCTMRLWAPLKEPCILNLGTIFSSTVEIWGLQLYGDLTAMRSNSISQIRVS